MKKIYLFPALCLFALAGFTGLSQAADAPKASTAPNNGVYCISDQDEMRVLALKPDDKGAMKFGISLWYPNGNNFAIYGKAKSKSKNVWKFTENLNSSKKDERCDLSIALQPDGSYYITTSPSAQCQSYGGRNATLTEIQFPKESFENPVSKELDSFESVMNAGKCSKGPNPRFK
jgi:hypothetical protein